jgi:hypothetical protein
MNLACRLTRAQHPLADAGTSIARPLASHVSSCLRCQAESVRYRTLRRDLAALASRIETAPSGLAGEIAVRIHDASTASDAAAARSVRVGAGAAAGAVVAAVGTVVMVRWLRARTAT